MNPVKKIKAKPTSKRLQVGDTAPPGKLALPNERDESVNMTPAQPDPVAKQAARDVARGLQDTSKGAEMDRTYKKLK